MSKYRIILRSESFLGAMYVIQKYVGWKFFGFWSDIQWYRFNDDAELAYRTANKNKVFLESLGASK